jgi:formyltetrahydrofolate deformylase
MTTRKSINAADTAASARHPPVGREALSINDVGRLLLRCAERPALVSAVSAFLAQAGANIVSLDQHSTEQSGGTLVQRNIFRLQGLPTARDARDRDFGAAGCRAVQRGFQAHRGSQTKRVAIMASKADHCLLDLIPYVEWLRLVISATEPRKDDLS